MLEKMGMVKSRREGMRYRAFYITGTEFPEEEKYRLTDLQIKILDVIKKNEGITQKEIASILGEKKQKINYNIKVLKQIGKVIVKKKGRKTRCYLSKQEKHTNSIET